MQSITISPWTAFFMTAAWVFISGVFLFIMRKGISAFLGEFKAIIAGVVKELTALTKASKENTEAINTTKVDTAKIIERAKAQDEKIKDQGKRITKVEGSLEKHKDDKEIHK